MPAEAREVPIPFNWFPRPHQRKLWRALDNGIRRSLIVAHRRWGKDDVALHWAATQCCQPDKAAVYWHMLPEASQARKAIWTAVNPHTGVRRIEEAFPPEIRDGPPRETDMLIRFKSGAIWQVVGSDNYNSLVGSPPYGVVMSEWAIANPAAWDFLEPVLEENGGWAMFISTPRGRNHMARMFDAYQGDPAWYVERSSAKDTDVFSSNQLDKIRRDYVIRRGDAVGKAFFNQEYLCSFDAPVVGAYYAEWIQAAEDERRITTVPYDPAYPVCAAWDIGYGDQTSIWVAQQAGREVRLIDYYANSGQAAGHYVEWLREQRYPLPDMILPHDAAQHEKASGQTYADALQKLHCKVQVLPIASLDAGIQAVRALLPRCVFDRERCQKGIDALRQYRADYDEKHEVLRPAPVHDWASHGCLLPGELVETTRGLVPIELVRPGDKVWTPSGISLVTHAGPVKMAKSLVEIWSDTGRLLTCTPEHKLLTRRGFVTAASLTTTDELLTGQEWTTSLIGFVSRVANIGFRATITGDTSGGRRGRQTYIGRLMSMCSARCRTVTRSIMWTGNRSTMIPAISWQCQSPSTSGGTRWNGTRKDGSSLLAQRREKRPPRGIDRLKGWNGTRETESRRGSAGSGSRSVVRSAVSRFARLILIAPSSAIRIARLRHVDAERGGVLVFDLTVEKNACYRANGLLVSNSDSFRYLAMGLDMVTGRRFQRPERKRVGLV